MWKRNELWLNVEDFQAIVETQTGSKKYYRTYTSTQLNEIIAKWMYGQAKMLYSRTEGNSVLLVSEPVLDPAFIKGVQEDLGDDVEIIIKEHDRPFSPVDQADGNK